MKKHTTLSVLLFFISCFAHAQLIDEDFNSSFPGLWTQWSGSSLVWEHNAQLGVNNSGCVLVDYSSSSSSGNAWIQTPFMNLSSIQDPEIVFSTALVQNNFLAPEISLWYDVGGGWIYITNWGSTSNSENFVPYSSDLMPPLDAANVDWVTDISYDLSALSSLTSVRFAFGADFSNGGWALLDNVKIQEGSGGNVGVTNLLLSNDLAIYPNPASDLLYIDHTNLQAQYVAIYDLSGRKVLDQSILDSYQTTLPVNTLEKGSYLLLLHCVDGYYSSTISIN